MRIHLAITPAALARLAQPPALPLAHIAYAIDEGGCLARARVPETLRGGLLGLSDRCAAPLRRPEALCRAIVSECRARGFHGVLADFGSPCCPGRGALLEQLSHMLAAQGRTLYCPFALAPALARALVGTAVSGGSLRVLLEEAANRRGAQQLALDLERVQMDFPLPCPSGSGTPLTHSELLALRQRHPSSVYFSRELMANYFTYTDGGGTHFVLFDDAETLRQKLVLAQRLGIGEAFVMYPETADLLSALEDMEKEVHQA